MEYDWQTEFGKALRAFHDAPGAQLEQQLLEAFMAHPVAVVNAIAKTIRAYDSGRAHSPWGMLRSEVKRQIERETTVSAKQNSIHVIDRAERWMRNAGAHFPTWDEVEDDLFTATTGMLHELRDDAELVARMHTLWLELHPDADMVEWDDLERAERWKGAQARMNEQRERELTEDEKRELATIKGGGDIVLEVP